MSQADESVPPQLRARETGGTGGRGGESRREGHAPDLGVARPPATERTDICGSVEGLWITRPR